MSNKKTKELVIFLIAIFTLILTIATTSVAVQDVNDLLGGTTPTTQNETNDFEEIPEADNDNNNNNNTNSNKETSTIQSTNNSTNTSNNTAKTIPYTGINYSTIILIAVCGVSAIYAYKKIRDYNV